MRFDKHDLCLRVVRRRIACVSTSAFDSPMATIADLFSQEFRYELPNR
jgi:hypothetical protein